MSDTHSIRAVTVKSGQAVPTGTTNGDWWAAGRAAHRPTVGTIPVVQTNRSFARSALIPGLMMICGAVVMVASTMPWLTANFLHHMSYISGTDQSVATAFGVNGWVTFACGGGLAVLSALMIISDEGALRVLAGFVSAAAVGLAGYELIRVLQQIHYARQASARLYPSLALDLLGRVHIGYGLIVVMAAAGVAFFAALAEASAD